MAAMPAAEAETSDKASLRADGSALYSIATLRFLVDLAGLHPDITRSHSGARACANQESNCSYRDGEPACIPGSRKGGALE
jgi:hypothetical protein